MSLRRLVGLWLPLCLLTVTVAAAREEPPVIVEIRVEGGRAVGTDTILYQLSSRVGEPLSQIKLRDDLRALYATGFFEDILLRAEPAPGGVALVVEIKERPVVREIFLSGNQKLSAGSLEEKIVLSPGDVYDPLKVQETLDAIRTAYQESGYNFVTITPLTQEVGLMEVALTLQINEGDQVVIKRVEFTGVADLNPGNRMWGLRRSLKNTRRRWWLSWLTGSGSFQRDLFQEDLEALRRHYEDQGYAAVELGEPQMETVEREAGFFKKKMKKFVTITIPVVEGDVHRIGLLTCQGNELFSRAEILETARAARKASSLQLDRGIFARRRRKLDTGEEFNATLLDLASERIAELYHVRGRIYARIVPERTLDEERRVVDVDFKIREGIEAFLNRLEFKGNVKTHDKVLRREFRLVEGESFNGARFKDSLGRLQYLGYVADIVPEVTPLEDPTQVDVLVGLDDSRQTEIQLAGGWSSSDRFYGTLSLAEKNLFGRGQELSVSASSSATRDSYSVRFADEYMFDTPYYGSLSGWRSSQEFTTSEKTSLGGQIVTGRPLASRLFGRIGYSYEIVDVFNIEDDASQEVQDAAGLTATSQVGLFLIRDLRNNRREPSDGSYNRLSFEVAGGYLGGDNVFYKTSLESSYYHPLWRSTVFAVHAQISYADSWGVEELPYFERYFLGGPRSLRGFRQNEVGPKDYEGRTVGGNKSLLVNSEFVIPLAGPLKVVPFLDAGDVWSATERYDLRTLRASTGVELRFFIPAFWVPLRFIWGYNLDRFEGEDSTEFQFTLGTAF